MFLNLQNIIIPPADTPVLHQPSGNSTPGSKIRKNMSPAASSTMASAPSNSYKSIALDTFHTNIPPEAMRAAEEGKKPPDIDMVYRIVWAYCVGDESSGWVPSKGTNSIRITRPNLITGHEDEDPVVEGKDADRGTETSATIDGSEGLTRQIPCEVDFRNFPYKVDYTCLYDTTTDAFFLLRAR